MTQETPTSGSFSGLFGAIKGALFEEDPKNKTTPKPAQASAAPSAGAMVPPASSVNNVGGPSLTPSTADNPMVANMMGIVMSKTTAYSALVEAITPLEAFLPDEPSRFKAAFSIVGKTRTVEQIVQAIEMQHLPALDAEIQRFNAQSQTHEKKEISDRQQEIEKLQANIKASNDEAARIRQDMEARLVELQDSALKSGEKIAHMVHEMNEKKAAMALVNEQFNSAVATVKTMLTDAKTKVLRYLAA